MDTSKPSRAETRGRLQLLLLRLKYAQALHDVWSHSRSMWTAAMSSVHNQVSCMAKRIHATSVLGDLLKSEYDAEIQEAVKVNLKSLKSLSLLFLALHPALLGKSAPTNLRSAVDIDAFQQPCLYIKTLDDLTGRAVRHSRRCCALFMAASSIADWPDKFDNSLLRELRPEDRSSPPHQPRQVYGAHYTVVRPTVPTPEPVLVACSDEVAGMLGVDPADEDFVPIFSGGWLPDWVTSWATVYGASFSGSYGGQRGDGRAISIGQVANLEVQLKGAGTTPYSRQFDGRAVLRSCVREFLASEAMSALNIPTTRALCVVASGDLVRRQWYADAGYEVMDLEPGAVGTRVAKSFLRFGQFELFWERGEMQLLRELAEHTLSREFSHLRIQYPFEPLSELFVQMFAEVCDRQAMLVAEWLRVGYCQGNMNSDNSALGGVTLDYGPFAFMERFQPLYNPWLGGGMAYAFERQPQAAQINLSLLARVFIDLIKTVCDSEGMSPAEKKAAVEKVRQLESNRFADKFNTFDNENCRRKLGLGNWDEVSQDLWDELIQLMSTCCGEGGVDFTLLFRHLVDIPTDLQADETQEERLLDFLHGAALQGVHEWPADHRSAWVQWVCRYVEHVNQHDLESVERRHMMNSANPKYILRNWMAAEAYDAAARGDYTIIRELQTVLSTPYTEQGSEVDERWARLTPVWARDRAGLAYMS